MYVRWVFQVTVYPYLLCFITAGNGEDVFAAHLTSYDEGFILGWGARPEIATVCVYILLVFCTIINSRSTSFNAHLHLGQGCTGSPFMTDGGVLFYLNGSVVVICARNPEILAEPEADGFDSEAKCFALSPPHRFRPWR